MPKPAPSTTPTIKGDSKANLLKGTDAAEIILGGGGNDTIFGDPGDVKLDGGAGVDTLDLSGADAGVIYNQRHGYLTYDLMAPSMTSVLNFERVIGSAFDDILSGGVYADTIAGGGGADTIRSGTGNDMLIGDFIDGYAHLQPGNRGADVFEFSHSEGGTDTVLDFEYGKDKLFFYGVPQPTDVRTLGEDVQVNWANGTIILVGIADQMTDPAALFTLSHGGISVAAEAVVWP